MKHAARCNIYMLHSHTLKSATSDYDQRYVIAFRPFSVVARSWSHDKSLCGTSMSDCNVSLPKCCARVTKCESWWLMYSVARNNWENDKSRTCCKPDKQVLRPHPWCLREGSSLTTASCHHVSSTQIQTKLRSNTKQCMDDKNRQTANKLHRIFHETYSSVG